MRRLTKAGIRRTALSLVGFALLILVWGISFLQQKAGTYLIPDPIVTFGKLASLISTGNAFRDLLETLSRMLCGFLLAVVAGTLFGLLLGSISLLRMMLDSFIDFFRSIPVTALYPVFVLLFGIGNSSKIAMIFWACFFIICVNTTYGVLQANPVRRRMADLYGASAFRIFRQITFFDALPYTIIGIRIAISYALIVSILTEMFMGSQYGIGQKITESYNLYQIDVLFAWIIMAGILGYLLNKAFVTIEKKLVGWKPNAD
jgi:ABC-type nitrate/sulfonate/bicarbonate transport system permease component